MSAFLIVFILFSVLITSILSGIVGMVGDVLLLVILGSALLPIQQTLVLYATLLFCACASRAVIHRKHLQAKSIEYYLVGLFFVYIFGSLPGIALDKHAQDFLLGVGMLLLGIAFFVPFFSRKRLKPDFSQPPQALICAVLVNGFASVDHLGFLLNLFFQDISMTRYQVIATKAAAQFIPYCVVLVHAGSAVLSAPAIPPELVWTCCAIIPVAILGSYLAKPILQRITDVQFYKTTQIILWVMGAIYLGEAALLLMQVVPEVTTMTKR